MLDYSLLRKEIDELYSLTNYEPIVYQLILELASKSYQLGRESNLK